MADLRLIDANAADVERICCYYGDNCRIEDVQEWLDDQPTIDAVPFKVLAGVCKHRQVACVDSDNRVYDHVCRKNNPYSWDTCSPETCPLIDAKMDAVPVVHAKWNCVYEDWRHQMAGNECSACGFVLFGPVGSYCPRCGAKMDGGT